MSLYVLIGKHNVAKNVDFFAKMGHYRALSNEK
jgi:hypothetical protein